VVMGRVVWREVTPKPVDQPEERSDARGDEDEYLELGQLTRSWVRFIPL